MALQPLSFDSTLAAYRQQAAALLLAQQDGQHWAIELFHQNHPRFLDEKVVWLPKRISDDEIQAAALSQDDAELAIARWYNFRDWAALSEWVHAMADRDSAVFHFESAVEAVIAGDLDRLRVLLEKHPELIQARSTRVTNFDPPIHRATLLHYLGANGVESYRQKSPANAVEVARLLLEAGAEPDAVADMYGGHCTTMSMLVSSTPPAESGVQQGLIHTLVDFGTSVEAQGEGAWTSPLVTALVFGFENAAETLVQRGARVDQLPVAAGLGRIEDLKRLLPAAGVEERHRALALAAQLGKVEIVKLLLDAGEDPNRYNPAHLHSHATPLHQAALAGHFAVVALLVDRGAQLDLKDKLWQATPLGWAQHGGKTEVAGYLSRHGAS
ncbi:ankyrin repeat domain-containing protein [Bryobacter aggregatus]|uniref:ankyrin repeat domain-containing protein n=1 Tax=Bryobacter aggregatus TaxID=360054 RepID=UPI0006896D1A|nr:ankyrin repeat domain-containing protein [Bryobacter aggregatus]